PCTPCYPAPIVHTPHRFFSIFCPRYCNPPHLHSFPTRRSSDLQRTAQGRLVRRSQTLSRGGARPDPQRRSGQRGHPRHTELVPGDRKSTRLNSSHVKISYAVFCLKKKKHTHKNPCREVNPPNDA